LGCTDDTSDTIKTIQNKDPELVLALGDLSYENTGNCWLNWLYVLLLNTKHKTDYHTIQISHKTYDLSRLLSLYIP
jgi:hypothetical protein